MEDITLLKVLSLDSIYGLIKWEERIMVHLYLRGKSSELTEKIINLVRWIEKNNWEAPKIIYKQDRLLYYTDNLTGNDKFLCDYAKNNPEVTEGLKKFMNEKN